MQNLFDTTAKYIFGIVFQGFHYGESNWMKIGVEGTGVACYIVQEIHNVVYHV